VTEFWSLELAALGAIRTEAAEWAAIVDQISIHSSVISRNNTGGGFFTEMKMGSGGTEIVWKNQSSQKDVWLSVERLEYGLGIILHLKDDGTALLEGYAVGPEDTSGIDFKQARFEIAEQPRPLLRSSR
jgi:hypothetical protein